MAVTAAGMWVAPVHQLPGEAAPRIRRKGGERLQEKEKTEQP